MQNSFDTTNTKKIWMKLNDLLGRKSKNDIQAIKIPESGDILTDHVKISNFFNHHFVSSITSFVKDLPRKNAGA